MKVVIFYFSGTGNTWWVTERIQEKLKEKDYDVVYHSMESDVVKNPEKVNELIAEADIVGFGYPIYGSDVPYDFLKFLRELSEVENKLAFVYTTMMLFSGDGAMVAKRVLKRKGYLVKQGINIIMPNNVKLPYPIFRHFPIRNGAENDKVKAKAMKKITKLVERIVVGKKWLQGWDIFSIIGGLMQRVEMRLVNMSVFARNYYVEKEVCTECMQCVETCPTKNIVFKEGVFSWEDRCTLCLRCYHMCPEDAIIYKDKTLDRKKYPRYKGPGDGFTVYKLQE